MKGIQVRDLADNGIGPPLPIQRPGNTALRWLWICTLKWGVPLAVRERMWIQHDGALPHFSVDVRNRLNAVFPDRWIWRGGPIPWLARSWTPGSLPQIVHWSIPYVLFNFCTLVLNHPVYDFHSAIHRMIMYTVRQYEKSLTPVMNVVVVVAGFYDTF